MLDSLRGGGWLAVRGYKEQMGCCGRGGGDCYVNDHDTAYLLFFLTKVATTFRCGQAIVGHMWTLIVKL